MAMSAHPGSNVMRFQPLIAEDSGSLASFWLSVSDWCTPAMTSWASANESAHRAWVDLVAEWQIFVGHRLNEDLRLFQELSAAKAPEEVWNAWSRFWQKASGDYGAEYSAITKRAACFMPHGIGAHTAAHAATTATHSKAA
jgi:hypothetical protein